VSQPRFIHLDSAGGGNFCAVKIAFGALRNIKILAPETAQIATNGGNRKRFGPEHKMVKRFFLDGVNIFGNHPAINQKKKFALLVFPDTANPSFERRYPATMVAGLALDIIALGFIKITFFHFTLILIIPDMLK